MTRPVAKKYVCGFLFNETLTRVALIRKNRGPADMAGRLNGIGGKIEPEDNMSVRKAMEREFVEETGVLVPAMNWMCFHIERYIWDSGSTVHFMTAVSDSIEEVKTTTDEQIEIHNLNPKYVSIPYFHPQMYNLKYLIPMAQEWHQEPKNRFVESE